MGLQNRHFYEIKKKKKRRLITAQILILIFFCILFFYLGRISVSDKDNKKASLTQASSTSTTISSTIATSASSESETTVSTTAEQPVQQVDLTQALKPLWVKVNISSQNVVIFDDNDKVVESFICSTGKEGCDTPTGTFTIQERGESFFSNTYQEGAYYWTQFQGDFLFHSVPFDANKEIEQEEADKLGSKASHGCVRLSIENAKWFYDNIPRGTTVIIE